MISWLRSFYDFLQEETTISALVTPSSPPLSPLTLLYKSAPPPHFRPKRPKEHRPRSQDHRHEAEQTRRPPHAKRRIHSFRRHAQPRAHQAPHHRISCNSAIGIDFIHINDVIEPIDHDQQDTHAHGHTGEDLRPGRDVRGRGPSPQEETRGKEEGAEDHGRETGFGRCGAGGEAGAVGVECVECVEGGGQDDANGYGEEGEGGFALLTISLRVKVGRKEGGGGE